MTSAALAPVPTPAAPILSRHLRDGWRGQLGWSLGIAAVIGMYLPLFPSLQSPELSKLIDSLPAELVNALGFDQIASGAGYTQATFFGLLSFKLPPSAEEIRELQKRAVQLVEGQQAGKPMPVIEAAGLSKRDYVPLAVALFVDLCLLLVSMGRPMNRLQGLVPKMREAERGPVSQILLRFSDIHRDEKIRESFEMLRHVVFDYAGAYYVAVPLDAPYVETRTEQVIDPRSDLAHQGGIAGIPGQTTDSTQSSDLVEVVADGRQLPPGCSDGIKLVCLDGQTIACLSDQMPDCLGYRQTACLGNRLKGCMLVFRDADVQLYRKPPHLLPVKAALES